MRPSRFEAVYKLNTANNANANVTYDDADGDVGRARAAHIFHSHDRLSENFGSILSHSLCLCLCLCDFELRKNFISDKYSTQSTTRCECKMISSSTAAAVAREHVRSCAPV